MISPTFGLIHRPILLINDMVFAEVSRRRGPAWNPPWVGFSPAPAARPHCPSRHFAWCARFQAVRLQIPPMRHTEKLRNHDQRRSPFNPSERQVVAKGGAEHAMRHIRLAAGICRDTFSNAKLLVQRLDPRRHGAATRTGRFSPGINQFVTLGGINSLLSIRSDPVTWSE